MESTTIHLKGYLKDHEDGVRFRNAWESIANILGNKIKDITDLDSANADEYQSYTSAYAPKVFFRFFVSDKKISLEDVKEKWLQKITGALDIYESWYGYSEYTVEGYTVENFTIGGHNIEQILESNAGKYAHILVDVYKK